MTTSIAAPRSLAALSAASLLLGISTACEPYEPLPRAQSRVFAGAHATLTCTQCHFEEGPPFTAFVWDTTCLSCHEADRKTPQHYTGQSCAGASCHSDSDPAWSERQGFSHDFLPLEGTHLTPNGCADCHEGATPTRDNVIPAGATSGLCWSCHEDDRPDDEHYVYSESEGFPDGAELRRDCKACHDRASRTPGAEFNTIWLSAFGKHADIRFPHGTENDGEPVDESLYVTDCAACHPAGPPAYVCTVACHAEIFEVSPHTSYTPGSADAGCTAGPCHPTADTHNIPNFP